MQSALYLGEKDIEIEIDEVLQNDRNILYGLRTSTQSPYYLNTSNEMMIHVKKYMEFVESVEIHQMNPIDAENFAYDVYVQSDGGSAMYEVKI